MLELIGEAVAGGASLVQLREKEAGTAEFLSLAREVLDLLRPLGVPLLTTIEHRAGLGAAVVSVQEVRPDGSLMPINGAMAVVPLDWLVEPSYALDRAGLTMWRNGFEEPGGDAQLDARVEFHLLVVRGGRIVTPEQMLAGDSAGARDR